MLILEVIAVGAVYGILTGLCVAFVNKYIEPVDKD